jgi:hypothetical protein
MLVFLKERGALLNTVAPEDLLSREDFLYYKVRNKEPLKHYLMMITPPAIPWPRC